MKEQNNKNIFTKMILEFKPFWKHLAIFFFLMILIQSIATFTPYLFGKGVDAVIKQDMRLAFTFVIIAFLVSLFQSIFFSWLRDGVEIKYLDEHIESFFSYNSLKKMFGFSIGQHVNEHSGVKQSVVNRGQNALTQFVFSFLYDVLPNIIQIIITIAILAFFDWKIALFVSVFVGLYVFISLGRNKDFFPKLEQVRKKNQEQSKLQSELFRNSTLVISEAQEEKTSGDYLVSNEKAVAFRDKTWLDYLKIFYVHKLLVIVGQYASLALGVYLIIIGEHSTGMFVTFYAWTSTIFGNLVMVMNQQRRLLFQIVEIRKYFELLDIVPDIDQNENGKILESLRGEIEFRNVGFAYPYRKSAAEIEQDEENNNEDEKKEDHAVSGINFKILAGAKVGFVGISGSGKSTIVNLMRRYYDSTDGEILIDGVNLKELNLRHLRHQIGNVEQKIELFDKSIKENILFGVPKENNITDKEINSAVDDASLSEFVTKLKENGLDTMIGEGGIKVSGGERQRIGIARALIKNPKILIFDEATSALDSINEKLIHEAINRGAKGRTTIIIAHRLSTIKDADKIFVVSEGKIVGEGKHEELLKSCEEYQELIKHQVF